MVQLENRNFFEKIGEVAVKFSNADVFISDLIYRLIVNKKEPEEIEKYLKKFYKEMPMKKKIELCKEVFPEKNPLSEKFSKIISKVDSIRETRNEFIHGLIEFKEENIKKGVITIFYKETKKYRIDELEEIIEKLTHLIDELVLFRGEMFTKDMLN